MRTCPIFASFASLALVGALSTGCSTIPTWSLRVENATGHDLDNVSMKIEEASVLDERGSTSHSTTTLRLTGGGGSASQLSAGDSATIEASVRGTPQVTLRVAWAAGEPVQEFHLAGLRPNSTSFVVRLTADRRFEIVDGK